MAVRKVRKKSTKKAAPRTKKAAPRTKKKKAPAISLKKRKTLAARKQKKEQIHSEKTAEVNRLAMWKAYHELQRKAHKAWNKLRSDANRNAKSKTIIRDQNHLLLLLGECNYMARECMRIAEQKK